MVAPEPPVRRTVHSPPESTGATSGTNARIDAASVRGVNRSAETRIKTFFGAESVADLDAIVGGIGPGVADV